MASSTAEFLFWLPLGGGWIGVYREDLSDDNLHGYFSGSENRLVLNIHLPPEMFKSVLLHEYLHAVCDSYQVNLKEKDVRIVEQGLMQLLNSESWRAL